MAVNVNKVMLVGRLGADPEKRGGESGPVVCRVATSESWRDKKTGDRQERTQWHQVVVWHEQSQKFLLDYVKKGDLVYVEGQLETREWEKDGERRYTTEVVIRPFSGSVQSQSKEKREDSGRDDGRSSNSSRSSSGGGGGYRNDIDDEIPFAPEWR